MPNILTESQIEKRIQDEIETRDSVREVEYKNKFLELKKELVDRTDSFLSESIVENFSNEVNTAAKLSVYAPIVEGIIKVFKQNGIKTPAFESVDTSEHEEVLMEAIDEINNLRVETDKLKKMVKMYETIAKHLSGLDQETINLAVNKFKDKDISESLLEEELTEFVLKRKSNSKKISLESIVDDSELSEIDSLLEGGNQPLRPKVKINVKGISPRQVFNESISEEVEDYSPANEVLASWASTYSM
jgi:hypothetical protein